MKKRTSFMLILAGAMLMHGQRSRAPDDASQRNFKEMLKMQSFTGPRPQEE